MGYRMKTLKTERFDASSPGGTFTNSSTANTTLSTGVGIFAPLQIPAFAGSGLGIACSNEDSNVAEIDVLGASASGTIYIYYTQGSVPANGQPPNSGDTVMAEINYGTGAFRYKASWTMPCTKGTGALYIAISSGTASSTISIAQFRLVVRILLFTLKA
jgi:hypothetical protein